MDLPIWCDIRSVRPRGVPSVRANAMHSVVLPRPLYDPAQSQQSTVAGKGDVQLIADLDSIPFRSNSQLLLHILHLTRSPFRYSLLGVANIARGNNLF